MIAREKKPGDRSRAYKRSSLHVHPEIFVARRRAVGTSFSLATIRVISR